MINEAVKDLMEFRDLEPETAMEVAGEIISGKVGDVVKAAFLTALRMKGETPEEIAAFAKVMREQSVRITPQVRGTLVDTCGTGGDALGTFNISTAAAFIVAGSGIPVAKHCNRSVSSRCGSADILEALGVKVDLEPVQVQALIEKVGIGFMFAPRFHPAMKNVQTVRRSLGVRTIFNILGPLTNPADAEAQVIGVYSPELANKIAMALNILGIRRAKIVHGAGLDELTTTGPNKIIELDNGTISESYFESTEFGIPKAEITQLVANDIEKSKSLFLEVLNGKEGAGLDIAVLNAAAAIIVGNKATSFNEGIELARESVFSGRAMEKLEKLLEEAARYEA